MEALEVPRDDFEVLCEVLSTHARRLDPAFRDSAFSSHVIKNLLPLYRGLETERLAELFDAFVFRHNDRLTGIYERYRDDTRDGEDSHMVRLVHSPASLMIWERATVNRFALREQWCQGVFESLEPREDMTMLFSIAI